MEAIRFERISKQFPNSPRPAVNDVSLEIEEGSLVVLLGPSGCGKTTLLKMVNRLVEPTSGTVYLHGRDTAQIEPTILRRQIGYVIQQVGLFPHLTVGENIAVVPELLGWPKQRISQRVEELMEVVDLPAREYIQRYPAQLSGGQQQRVGVARALAADPAVLLMDEPFGALDALTRAGLQKELLRLHQTFPITTLFVTHDVEEALYLGDKIAVIRSGKVVQYGTPLELLSDPADQFTRDLLGADDVIRRLGQIRASQAMKEFDDRDGGAPQIDARDSLRSALSLLLSAESSLLVVTENGEPVGVIDLVTIREAAGSVSPHRAAGEGTGRQEDPD